MKINRIHNSYFHRIWKRGDGLFIGFRVHTPVTLLGDGDEMFSSIIVSFGFLFWELCFSIDYNHRIVA